MDDRPYCKACKHFNEVGNERRCWHPPAIAFDRVEGESRPIITHGVTRNCDIYGRFEKAGGQG